MTTDQHSDTGRTSRRRQAIAAKLGLIGGGLGIVAGLLQTFFGHQMGTWSGAKANPVGLGVLTVVLSGMAILSALWFQGRIRSTSGAASGRYHPPLSQQQRAAVLVGLLVPAALGLSTVGRLWYLPGADLIAAGVLAAAGNTGQLWTVVRAQWVRTLISLLGGIQILMAVSAAPIPVVILGVVGGIVLAGAPWVPAGRSVRLTLISLGALPFAVLTWWSLVTPLLAVLAIALGFAAYAHRPVIPVAPMKDIPVPVTPGR